MARRYSGMLTGSADFGGNCPGGRGIVFTSSATSVSSGMSISEEQVKNALKSVKYPGFTRDIVSFGLVKSV